MESKAIRLVIGFQALQSYVQGSVSIFELRLGDVFILSLRFCDSGAEPSVDRRASAEDFSELPLLEAWPEYLFVSRVRRDSLNFAGQVAHHEHRFVDVHSAGL